LGLFAHEYSSNKKKIFEFLLEYYIECSSSFEDEMFTFVRDEVGASVPKIFFLASLSFFLSVSHHFFLFFFSSSSSSSFQKKQKALASQQRHTNDTQTEEQQNNERKSIDQIIIKNQKCKARDTRTCSSANARAGKT